MAKFTIVKILKSKCKLLAAGMKAGPVINLALVDNENATGTIMGQDAQNQTFPIDTQATLAVTDDAPAICKTTIVSGLTFNIKAQGPVGVDNVGLVVTQNPGATTPWGPFSASVPVTVTADTTTPTGIAVSIGTPVAN